jgi:hypothetical protein
MLIERLAVMPRYYFHVRNDVNAEDEEGLELPDLAAARETAVEAARDMCCADIKQGWLNLDSRVDVTDEQGETLLSVTFGQAFEVRNTRR